MVPRTDDDLPDTVPASQTALHEVGRRVSPEQVPLHELDAFGEDMDHGGARFGRRVVLHPQSSGGTPRSVQDRSPNMSMCGNRFAALAGTETVTMPASTGSFRNVGHQRLRAEPTSADDTLLDSDGPTQRESQVQFSKPDEVSGLNGNASESDLVDDSDPDDDPHQVPVEQHVEHPRWRLVLVGGVQGRGRDVVSSQATVANPAPDVVDALELDLGEVVEPPRQPIVVPMTDSEGTSGLSSDTESVFGDHEVVERDQAQDVEEVQVGPQLREEFRSLKGVDVGPPLLHESSAS